MSSLPALCFLLLLTISSAHAAVANERPSYDFDFRQHLEKLGDASPFSAHSHDHGSEGAGGGCGCGAHNLDSLDPLAKDDDDNDEDGIEVIDVIPEDGAGEETAGVPEAVSHHSGCSLCGDSDHSDGDHAGHAHKSDHAHHRPGHTHHSDHAQDSGNTHQDHRAGRTRHSRHIQRPGHTHHAGHKPHDDQKIYRFRIGMDMPNTGYLYKNAEGRMEGFIMDLIANVCRTAGKICHPIVDRKDRCWEHVTNSPGIGLVSGWYDGCVGFFPTPEKHDSFDFSEAFSLNPVLALHFSTGKVPTEPTNLANKKIGFIRGLPMNAACLSRQRAMTGTFSPVLFDSIPQLVGALAANQIDAFPWMANFTEPRLHVQMGGPSFTCTTQGLSVMVRKGDPLVTWWDAAYRQLVEGGQYSDLCRRSREQPGYKGRVYCRED